METAIYVLTLSLIVGTVLIVFGMKYFSAILAARARLANDDAYRILAEKAVAAQSENQTSLSAVQAELSKVSASLAAVEKILKQVE
jgi:uncharacterized membrane protein